jgi:hypothetical protein
MLSHKLLRKKAHCQTRSYKGVVILTNCLSCKTWGNSPIRRRPRTILKDCGASALAVDSFETSSPDDPHARGNRCLEEQSERKVYKQNTTPTLYESGLLTDIDVAGKVLESFDVGVVPQSLF